jgi:hypothetical protein
MSTGRVHVPERAQSAVLARRGSVSTRATAPRVLVGELEGTLGDLRAGLEQGWRGYLPRLAQLRAAVAAADEESYAAARAWAEAQRARAPLPYAAVLAFLFDAEPWCDDVLREAGGLIAPPSAAVLALSTSRDAELVALVGAHLANDHAERVLERGPDVIEAFAHQPEVLEAILVAWSARLEVATKRARGSQRAWDLEGAPSRMQDLLAHVGTEGVAARIAKLVGRPSARQLVVRYFRRFPELAEPALRPLAKGRGKARDAAVTLLEALASPSDAEPRAHAAAAPDGGLAPEDALPPILREPPWRHWKSSGLLVVEEPPIPVFDLPPEATAKHDREAWITRLPSVTRTLIFSSRAAFPVAHAWLTQRAQRSAAEDWLRTFAPIAIYGLVPYVIGEPGPSRALATSALRHAWSAVASERGPKILERWVDDAGPSRPGGTTRAELLAAIEATLRADPRWDCPAQAPAWPSFLAPAALPEVRLRDGRALPAQAVRHLVEMMIFAGAAAGGGDLVAEYTGAREVREALDLASLEALSQHVFEAWSVLGQGTRSSWPLGQIALFGGRSAARRLALAIRTLATERAVDRAVEAVSVLARLRTGAALVHLHLLAESAKNERVRAAARELVEATARSRGLSREELEDLLVPDPAALETADPKTARAELESARKAQAKRLERAMCTGRSWPVAAFRERIVAHPLLGELARGLVWRAIDEGREHTLRVAEDGTLASIEDEVVELGAGALLSIPHPLSLDPALRDRWAAVLGDYELLQPFAQLSRDTYALAADEQAAAELERFRLREGETALLYALEQRGWAVRGSRAYVLALRKPLRDGLFAELQLVQHVDLGRPRATPTFSVACVKLLVERDPAATARKPPTFAALSPVEASELVRDLGSLLRS